MTSIDLTLSIDEATGFTAAWIIQPYFISPSISMILLLHITEEIIKIGKEKNYDFSLPILLLMYNRGSNARPNLITQNGSVIPCVLKKSCITFFVFSATNTLRIPKSIFGFLNFFTKFQVSSEISS